MSLLLETLRGYDSGTLQSLLDILKVKDIPQKRDERQSLLPKKLAQYVKIEPFLGDDVIMMKSMYATAQKLKVADIDWESAGESEIIDKIYHKYKILFEIRFQKMSAKKREKLLEQYQEVLKKDGEALIGETSALLTAIPAGGVAYCVLPASTAAVLKASDLFFGRTFSFFTYAITLAVLGIFRPLGSLPGGHTMAGGGYWLKGAQINKVATVILALIMDYKIREKNQIREEWASYALEIADKLKMYETMIAKAEYYLNTEDMHTSDYRQTDWYQWFKNEVSGIGALHD